MFHVEHGQADVRQIKKDLCMRYSNAVSLSSGV